MWLANRLFPSVRRLRARLAAAEAELNSNHRPHRAAFPCAHAEYWAFLDKFYSMLNLRAPGRLLEIGARNRTSADREPRVPKGWKYEGLDILPDRWVTIIGDAHDLRDKIDGGSIDAVISAATFEHLLMPWKVALEINYVLRTGGLVFIASHQTFPLHEMPADYWRFSSGAWHALFNAYTGFQILENKMSCPVSVVARTDDPGLSGLPDLCGYLFSMVIAKKIRECDLAWPVSPRQVLEMEYPR